MYRLRGTLALSDLLPKIYLPVEDSGHPFTKNHNLGGINNLCDLAIVGQILPLPDDNCQHFSHGLGTTNGHESISAAVFLIARGS